MRHFVKAYQTFPDTKCDDDRKRWHNDPQVAVSAGEAVLFGIQNRQLGLHLVHFPALNGLYLATKALR
ncbi:hypothetical protein D3C80_895250 [compost metagenome]